MSSTVEELKARLEEAKRRRLAELVAKTAAQAAAAPHVSDAAPPPTTVVHQVSPSSEPAPVEMKPTTVGVPQTATSRPQTPAPVLVPPPLEVNDGKEAPDFSRRSRRGNPPSVLRDPAAVPRVTAAKLLLAAVKPSLRGVTPVPPPPEFPTLQRPKRGARDDSLGRASSLSGDESDTAVDGKRRLTDVSALPSEPPKAAHRSEQGQQVAAEALPSKVSIGPLRRLPPDLDGAMKENELPRQRNTRSAAEFNRNRRISEGVYGVVYEGTEIATKKHYALKWIKDRWFIESKVGFPDYLLREIDLMARLRHPNIVSHVCMATCPNLHPTDMSTINNGDGASSDGNIKLVSLPTPLSASPRVPPSDALHTKLFLVAEYAGATLRNEIYRTNEPLNLASIKWLLCQLLRGIRFMHTHHILHRDLKPSNVLVDDEATVKVCDMGLARVVRPVDANLTTTVITLMYRPPELHFGVRTYEASVDMWSIGCIAAEMVLRQPLFPCSEDNEHLQKICEVLGAPTNEAIFPGMMQFSQASEGLSKVRVPPEAAKAPECYSVPIGATSTTFISCLRLRRALLAARPDINTSDGLALIDLIDRLIQWSPRARLTAAEALEHPFFTKGDDASAEQIKARRDAYFAEKAKHRAEASAIKAARAASVAKMEGVPLTTAADETPAKASDDDEVDNAAEGVAPKDVGVHHVAHDEDAVA